MKKTTLILSILITSFLSSCSTEDNKNEPINSNHLVKREYVSNNVNLEYRYNENGHLTRILDIDIQEEIDSEINFTYDSNNVVSRNIVSNNSNYHSTTNYSYNGNSRLENVVSTIDSGYKTTNITQEFSYNNNIITINISSNSEQSSIITLEVNSSGLVTKITKAEYYTVINYDSNGNISEIKLYNNDDTLMNTTEYAYDNKPNPFYGKLKSIYLPIFLHAFRDDFFSEFVWDGYEGYYFPFLRNNITSIMENGNLDRNYNYLYHNQNYPINVIEEFNGNNTYEFDIEYE